MTYDASYELEALRGEDLNVRPWDLMDKILNTVLVTDDLLDIGCGTAIKLLPIARVARSIIGLEPNPAMRQQAAARLAEVALTNVQIVDGLCDKLPFADDSFDVVTCMMAPHNTAEVHRVLKPGGVAILEKIGEQDKNVLKSFFGSDEQGKRGQFMDLQPNERADMYREEFGELFSDHTVRQGYWTTLLTEAGLDLLLAQTPTIRNFDPMKDAASVQTFKDRHMQAGRVKVTQHRLLITATK